MYPSAENIPDKMWITNKPVYGFGVIQDSNITAVLDGSTCPILQKLGFFYKSIHGYTSLTVCSYGVMANIINLIVLTRPEMNTPTNLILSGLAFADMLNMVEYIPFVIYTNFLPDLVDGNSRKSWGWALFVLFHSNFSQVCHTIAICLTLTLAIWRYIVVKKPLKSRDLLTMMRAKWAVVMAYTVSPLLCIPIYCSFSISPISQDTRQFSSGTNQTENINLQNMFNLTGDFATNQETDEPSGYIVNLSNLALSYPFLQNANFWFFGVVIKLIPCAILTILSHQLIKSLKAGDKRKRQLHGKRSSAQDNEPSCVSMTSVGETARETGNFTREIYATRRTTRMLVAVLVLFLITEFPQGVLTLLSGVLGEKFFTACYMPLSDLMDFVALLNSAINFILYCTMSRRFREVFRQVILCT